MHSSFGESRRHAFHTASMSSGSGLSPDLGIQISMSRPHAVVVETLQRGEHEDFGISNMCVCVCLHAPHFGIRNVCFACCMKTHTHTHFTNSKVYKTQSRSTVFILFILFNIYKDLPQHETCGGLRKKGVLNEKGTTKIINFGRR